MHIYHVSPLNYHLTKSYLPSWVPFVKLMHEPSERSIKVEHLHDEVEDLLEKLRFLKRWLRMVLMREDCKGGLHACC